MTFRGVVGSLTLDAACVLPARGITVVFGPSGCGKTTLLRCVAGLHRVEEGVCMVEGEVWQNHAVFLPPHHRPIGYVFQEASLFPHLSVRRNLLFGATRGAKPDANRIDFDQVTDLLGVAHLLDRSPRHLSGGERQRVAIGRALLSNPRLLLMDEPLSALDRQTKDEILPFIERLQDRLSLPVIYVTHDMAEVERLAHHLVLMRAGRVLASGPLGDLQSDPTLPLASAREAAVSLDALIQDVDADYGLLTLSVAGVPFLVPGPPGPVGEARRLRIAAGDVSLARHPPQASTILNVLPVMVLTTTQIGRNEILAVLALRVPDGQAPRLLARVTRRSWEKLGLAEGVEAFAQVKSVALAPASHP